jgi:hypothetical protein
MLRQNNVLLNPCYRHGNPNAKKFAPKTEFKLYGWVRETRKAYKQYVNNKSSIMNNK